MSAASNPPPTPPHVLPRSRYGAPLLAVVLVLLVLSGIHPFDMPTWWLEIGPILFAVPILVSTRKRFPLTTLSCVLLAIHAVILMVGGRYTYAKVPIGDWVRDVFHLARNPYDKLGHLAQGFFNPRHAGRASHAANLQPQRLLAHRIAGLFNRSLE